MRCCSGQKKKNPSSYSIQISALDCGPHTAAASSCGQTHIILFFRQPFACAHKKRGGNDTWLKELLHRRSQWIGRRANPLTLAGWERRGSPSDADVDEAERPGLHTSTEVSFSDGMAWEASSLPLAGGLAWTPARRNYCCVLFPRPSRTDLTSQSRFSVLSSPAWRTG